MMIATIQPRHRRLWQAAQQKNWAFAAYELGNLQGAFKRLGQAHPSEHDMSLPEMISSVTDQPFTELGTAIRTKDELDSQPRPEIPNARVQTHICGDQDVDLCASPPRLPDLGNGSRRPHLVNLPSHRFVSDQAGLS